MSTGSEFESLQQNPYASPQSIEPARPAVLPAEIWVVKDRVIAHRKAIWPRLCVLTNATGDKYLDLTMETHYPLWLFLAFIGCFVISLALAAFLVPMPYTTMIVIATLIANAIGVTAALVYFARPAKIRFYLCSAMFERRQHRLRLAILLNGAGIAAMAGSFFLHFAWTGPVFVGGLILLGFGGRLQRQWNGILLPHKMAREYIVFRGAGKEFLTLMPEWPFGPV